MLGNRQAKTVLNALMSRQHYIALANMYRYYPRFLENLRRYLTGWGDYPCQVEVRTPMGMIRPTLYTHHDLLTVNEIFCRQDYCADTSLKTVVDLGSNIGISALYFLTRNDDSRCYLFEPDQRNTARLRKNLAGYEHRYELNEVAVADEAGRVRFGIEPTGRYGGIGAQTDEFIDVECLNVNEVLERILCKEKVVDVLKVDTEGVEIQTVQCIKPEHLRRIRKIYMEAGPKERIHPDLFDQRQYGSVCQLTNRATG